MVVALETERRWIPRRPEALIARTGIGAARAEAGARDLLSRHATALASWGVAGGLEPALRAGAVIVPSAVITADGRTIPCDEHWRQRLLAVLDGSVPISRGALAEAAAPVVRPEDKSALHAATGAAAVDMESGAVARVAADHGVPWLAVRAVLDPALWRLPAVAATAIGPDGRLDPGFAARLAAAPRQWPDLLRLAAAQLSAGRSMRRAWAAAPALASAQERG